MSTEQQMNDPRSIGYGMQLQAWVSLVANEYDAALDFAEKGISIARTPYDREVGKNAKFAALVLLRRPGAYLTLRDFTDQCEASGWHYMLTGTDGVRGVALVLDGQVSAGIRWTEQAILRRDNERYRRAADWYRLFLCEIYLEIISGTKKPPANVILRNMLTLITIMFAAQKRIVELVEQVRRNPEFDPNGQNIGWCEMILGLLYKAKQKRTLAVQHLTEAKRIVAQFGPSLMLSRIDAALAEIV